MKRMMKPVVSLCAGVALALTTLIPSAHAERCGIPKVVTLFAGQTIDAGTVTVENDENDLYVTFTSAHGWWLRETHLHVADALTGIPTTKKGNPKVGHFAYQRFYDPEVSEDMYVIAKPNLSLDASNSVVIAAHAVVVQPDHAGNVMASETGWADGDPFVEKGSWATYLQYTWQACGKEPLTQALRTETAFAFGGGVATCFLDISRVISSGN